MQTIELPTKLFFRIGEVARLLEVKPHVIRYWEKEFKALRPKKSAAGQRIFTRQDVQRLSTIKHLLYVERFTIEGARKHLRDNGYEVGDTEASPDARRAERLRQGLIESKNRLSAFLSALDAVGGASALAQAAGATGTSGTVRPTTGLGPAATKLANVSQGAANGQD
jgi:DNA-binding transcriptional MerR regulator